MHLPVKARKGLQESILKNTRSQKIINITISWQLANKAQLFPDVQAPSILKSQRNDENLYQFWYLSDQYE